MTLHSPGQGPARPPTGPALGIPGAAARGASVVLTRVVEPAVTLPRIPLRRGVRRSLAGHAGQAARSVFWIALTAFILLPCLCFLIIAVSPRLFDQGSQWFTLSYLRAALNGASVHALLDSLWVSAAAGVLGVALGAPIAWLVMRTSLPGRRVIRACMWLVLLLPSWLPALGWVRLIEPDGVLDRIGIGSPLLTHAILGPAGVVLLLALRSVPFAFLAVSAALGGLGQEFEDAARVHGAGTMLTVRLVARIIAPAIWSALAIGFAESVSDFGVAATLAYAAHFPLATYQLYAAIGNFPPSFPAAAASGWLLVASVAVPLALQARALRGGTYAVLSGRARQVSAARLSRRGTVAAGSFVAMFFLLTLGVPGIGALSGSLLADYGSSFNLTFANYSAMFHNFDLIAPIARSLVYGLIAATVTVVAGFTAARLLSTTRNAATRALDYLLLAAVALPSVVFAAGYIFAYNLPAMSRLGINLYQTTTLLVIAYVASSLPTNARILLNPAAQLQPSLHDAARVHGAGPIRAWAAGVLPAVSRPLVMAWLLTFAAVFLELPISQLLYAPSSPPLSVAIEDNLANYHFGVGIAQSVLAVAVAFAVVGVAISLYRVIAPSGWRRIGEVRGG